jgi:hypothetical protein
MPKETGKGYLSGNLCGFKLQSTNTATAALRYKKQ